MGIAPPVALLLSSVPKSLQMTDSVDAFDIICGDLGLSALSTTSHGTKGTFRCDIYLNIYIHIYIYIYICVCVCACVCVFLKVQ